DRLAHRQRHRRRRGRVGWREFDLECRRAKVRQRDTSDAEAHPQQTRILSNLLPFFGSCSRCVCGPMGGTDGTIVYAQELRGPPLGCLQYRWGGIGLQVSGKLGVESPIARVLNAAQAPGHDAQRRPTADLEDLLAKIEVMPIL